MSQQSIPLQPLFDRVILKLTEPDTKSVGGILLTESRSEKPTRGTVLAVGPGKTADNGQPIPMTVQVGDEVIFSTYSPEMVTISGEEYYIIREESILAIVNK